MSAQTAQSERRHLARNDDDVQNIGQVSEQPIKHRVDRRVLAQMMIIVQNQDQLLFDSLQNFIQENINRAFRMLREFAGRLPADRRTCFAKAGHLLLDAEGEITKKHGRIGVGVVELIPDKLPFVSSEKVRNQRGFSGAGIGGDQR